MAAERGDRGAVGAGRAQAVNKASVDQGLLSAAIGEVVADQLVNVGLNDGQVQRVPRLCHGAAEPLVVGDRRGGADAADEADMHGCLHREDAIAS